MDLHESKKQLRKELRQARRNLSPEQQTHAANQLITVLKPHIRQNRTKRVALYTAMDGELDLAPFIDQCRDWRIDVYLPILHRFNQRLWFARFDEGDSLFDNRFGIPEPLNGAPIHPWQLNLVLFPLVGFDTEGGRLGMGGGFYDRTFAHSSRWPTKPALIGVAHECQKVAKIPRESWDINLDGVVTDKQFYRA